MKPESGPVTEKNYPEFLATLNEIKELANNTVTSQKPIHRPLGRADFSNKKLT
ncbi:MAG: hypothetical protein JW841_13395 [Deltaproteobacteria bacterium]|nr:hypothetical protein [Deltaproteobacteria bacterium]